jgi:hypothetical protein
MHVVALDSGTCNMVTSVGFTTHLQLMLPSRAAQLSTLAPHLLVLSDFDESQLPPPFKATQGNTLQCTFP